MLSIYVGETEEMAVTRFSTALRDLDEFRRLPKEEKDFRKQASELASDRIAEEAIAEFVPKEGRTFIRNKDGKVEYVDYLEDSLTFYSGDEQLWTISLGTKLCKAHNYKKTDSVCIYAIKNASYIRVDRKGRITTTTICNKHTNKHYFSKEEKQRQKSYMIKILAELVENDKREIALDEIRKHELREQYTNFVEILKLRLAIRAMNGGESSPSMSELKRVPRPMPNVDLVQTSHYCDNSITPDVKLYIHRDAAILEADGWSRTLPKLSKPACWTINRIDNGHNWFSVKTETGWLGFDLLDGSSLSPLSYQLNFQFEQLNFEGQTFIKRSGDIVLLNPISGLKYYIKQTPSF